MQTYRLTLRPLSALGTPLAGDTLLGQLCWTLRHQLGNDALTRLLAGYTEGQPFAVVSDALPHDHIPLPSLPSSAWQAEAGSDRKVLKKKRWLPLSSVREQLSKWQQKAVADGDLGKAVARAQPHNTINRQTGTTGTGMFAPYTMGQTWLHPDSLLDLVVVLDESRLSVAQLQAALAYIGQHGYGRDASIGLGKFAQEVFAGALAFRVGVAQRGGAGHAGDRDVGDVGGTAAHGFGRRLVGCGGVAIAFHGVAQGHGIEFFAVLEHRHVMHEVAQLPATSS